MKKNFIAITLIALFISMALTGCEKEKIEPNIKSSLSIRKFQSLDELYSEVKKTTAMDFDQLCDYEKNIGFNSFGKLAEMIYNPIVENDTNISIEELTKIVEKHSDYLSLNEVSKELYFDTKYSNSALRYVMNKDRIFQIDTLLYKVFENGIVSCNETYYDLLINITEKKFGKMESDDVFTIYRPNESEYQIPLPIDECGINDKEKVRFKINYCELYRTSICQKVNIYGLFSEQISGWRKFICWYNVRRHITADYYLHYSLYTLSTPYIAFSHVPYQTVFKKHLTNVFNFHIELPLGVTDPSVYLYQATGNVRIPAISLNLSDLQ